jgi:hypothetical protein
MYPYNRPPQPFGWGYPTENLDMGNGSANQTPVSPCPTVRGTRAEDHAGGERKEQRKGPATHFNSLVWIGASPRFSLRRNRCMPPMMCERHDRRPIAPRLQPPADEAIFPDRSSPGACSVRPSMADDERR